MENGVSPKTQFWRTNKLFNVTRSPNNELMWASARRSKAGRTPAPLRLTERAPDRHSGSRPLSGLRHKYEDMRCAELGLGLGATKEHSLQRSVTEEQQRPRPNAAQPIGRPSFFALTALLAPYRPLRGMLVARALSARKIPGRACVDNSVSQY